MSNLFLFDIDKTLIKGAKGHHMAFSEAFKKVFGVNTDIDIIEHDGMTDQQIIIEVLKKNGVDEETTKLKMTECMAAMVNCFNRVVKYEKIMILDGVPELLEELEKKEVLLGLVTGNLEPIARAKLTKIGLNHYFKLGGFGSDDINRTNLVKWAIKKAEEKFGFKFDNNVFLIGDTPRDMKAGKEAGVKTIGVMTGIYSEKELKEGGTDFIMLDLKNKKKLLKIIL